MNKNPILLFLNLTQASQPRKPASSHLRQTTAAMADEQTQTPPQTTPTKQEKQKKKPLAYVTDIFKVPYNTVVFWAKGGPKKERMDSNTHPQPQ